jgi:hypothetical protein
MPVFCSLAAHNHDLRSFLRISKIYKKYTNSLYENNNSNLKWAYVHIQAFTYITHTVKDLRPLWFEQYQYPPKLLQ